MNLFKKIKRGNSDIIYNVIVWLSVFSLTITWNPILIEYSTYVFAFGSSIMIAGILIKILRKPEKCYLFLLCESVFITLFLSIGIIVNNISAKKTIILICSFALMGFFYSFGYLAFNSDTFFLTVATSIVTAFAISVLLSPILGYSIWQVSNEVVFQAFTGGLGDKNTAATALLMASVSLSIHKKFHSNSGMLLKALSLLILIGIIWTSSRTIWIMLVIFLILENVEKIKKLALKYKKFLPILVVAWSLCLVFVFIKFVLHSQNLGFRVIGLVEYCKLHGGDIGNMLFGVGKKLYDTPDSYSDAFWNLTLGRGTYESGILNILVKNGAIGFIPYFYMIIKPLRKALICPRKREHTLLLALVIPMALSLIPELFFTQIRYTYTLFTLCYISYFYHNEMTPINDLKVFPQERSNC